jgi:hypothetical protein
VEVRFLSTAPDRVFRITVMMKVFLEWLFTLPAKKKWSWKTWVVLILSVIIVLFLGLMVVKTFNLGISFGQNGGQTAGTIINFRPPDRRLDDEIVKELEEKLSAYKAKTVLVSNAAGDWEAYDLANKIGVYLEKSGWKVVRYHDGDPIKPGISFEYREAGPVVQVGKNT